MIATTGREQGENDIDGDSADIDDGVGDGPGQVARAPRRRTPVPRTTSRVAAVVARYADGRSPTELARDTRDPETGEQRVKTQNMYPYASGKFTNTRTPANSTMMGMSDALGLPDDVEVLLAFGADTGLRIPDKLASALALALRPNVEVFDRYPELVSDLSTALSEVARAIQRAEESTAEGADALPDALRALKRAYDRMVRAVTEVLTGG